MKTAICTLQSVTAYSQNRAIQSEKKNKESAADWERRCWRERMHVNSSGNVVIPAMAFKHVLADIAAYLSEKIKGKGNNTWTKHFQSGVLPMADVDTGYKASDVQGEVISVPIDGKRGGKSRVPKTFPVIPKWSGQIEFHIGDDSITEEVFKRYLTQAGYLIGVGRWRARNGGLYGRFEVKSIKWKDDRS